MVSAVPGGVKRVASQLAIQRWQESILAEVVGPTLEDFLGSGRILGFWVCGAVAAPGGIWVRGGGGGGANSESDAGGHAGACAPGGQAVCLRSQAHRCLLLRSVRAVRRPPCLSTPADSHKGTPLLPLCRFFWGIDASAVPVCSACAPSSGPCLMLCLYTPCSAGPVQCFLLEEWEKPAAGRAEGARGHDGVAPQPLGH